jgi:hypothetical protein
MVLEDIANHSYYVLARKSTKENYVFAIYANGNLPLLAHLPSPMTKEESAKATDLLKAQGYETTIVQYNPNIPGGVIDLGVLTLNKAMPELIALGDNYIKASKK